MRRIAAISVLLGATTLIGCSGEDVQATRAAVNGDVDDGSYPGVMGMFINKPSGVARCTGTLLAPNLVLTARHCVSPTSGGFVDCGSSPLGPPVAGDQALSTTEGTMPPDDLSVYVAGSRISVPADGNDECGFDIAAVVLTRNLDASEATVFPPRLDTPVVAGERVTAVGFGSTGGGGLGVRRVREGLEIVCVGAAECGGGFVQDTELLAGDGVFCQFDSGAPALDAEGQVVGVTSRGVNPCDAPILSATHAWADWLRALGRDAAAEGGYATPEWAMETTSTPDAGGDAAVDDASAGDAFVPDASGDGGSDAAGSDAGAPGDDTGGCRAAGRTSPGSIALFAVVALLVTRRRRVSDG